MSKLNSRKFWVAVGTVFSIALFELTGYDLAPEAIAGIVIAISSYVVSQGIVDKSVVTKQVEVANDVGRAQLEAYARRLEAELSILVDGLPEE